MSMLAGPKRKQKLMLNPRGKFWAEDSNKFGQKLLEKMGWTPGKGLGAKEDGMTEHVKLKYKNDSEGIGYKDNGEQWTEHGDAFTKILQNLNGDNHIKLEKPDKSLEQKSQNSRARVHYKKFTRGKDLSQRSEKDIAQILGRKTLQKSVKVEEKTNEIIVKHEDPNFITSGSNMFDYFKSKININNYSIKKETDENSEPESELEIGKCTGFGFSSNQYENQNDNEISGNTNESKTNNRKRKADDDLDSTNDDTPKKSKKKKKKMAFDNLGNDINIDEEVCYDNPCLNENDNTQRKKKRKVTFASPEIQSSSDNESKKSKKKMLKLSKTGIDNPACEENGIDNLACEETTIKEKTSSNNPEINISKKKKKKSKLLKAIDDLVSEANGIDNLACEETTIKEETSSNNSEINTSKKKKKKSKLLKKIDDLVSEEDIDKLLKELTEKTINQLTKEISKLIEETTEQENSEVKKKKKKVKLETEIDNLASNDQKGKKNKSKMAEGIENKVCKIDTVKESINSINNAKNKSKMVEGIENKACKIDTVEESINSINNAIDNYQTELENEINEQKTNEKRRKIEHHQQKNKRKYTYLMNKLKFCTVQETRFNPNNKEKQKSLKEILEPGQLELNFKGSNIKEILGYGVKI